MGEMRPRNSSGNEANCFLCKNVYTDPRLLPCGHSFCCSCMTKFFLEKTGKALVSFCPDPNCMVAITTKDRRPQGFPVNQSMKKLNDQQCVSSTDEHLQWCLKHSTELKEHFCSHCQIALCETCFNSKHRGKPHFNQTIPSTLKQRQQALDAFQISQQSIQEISRHVKEIQNCIQGFPSNKLADACNTYAKCSIYSENLKQKYDELEKRIQEQHHSLRRLEKTMAAAKKGIEGARSALNNFADELKVDLD
ncbi:E3 ubiquitin-protein ligase TRIM58-like isoform X2 [Convolutriloba macropyga]|uniref:E3 ubiquitin-protein ligase TRIM58-like isoform X2 n=1 Tax=Convolutriloba macropyga TaxID=536237 RepID=UPI003F527B9C